MANDAEDRKSSKYRSLAACYSFKPVAVETLGALGEEASAFFQDLGRRITAVTAEPRSFQFIMQRLGVTLQRSNAACVWAFGGLWAFLWDIVTNHIVYFKTASRHCRAYVSLSECVCRVMSIKDGNMVDI